MSGYRYRLRALSPNAKLYLVSTVFRAAHLGIWMLLFNLYLTSLDFDVAFIGLLNTLLSVASILFSLPAGLIADRIGRKRAFVIGLLGMVLSRFGVATFSQGWLIAIFHTLFGAVGPLLYTSVPPFLMENSAAEERALLFTLDAGLMNFSMFAATTLGGYLPGLFASVLRVGVESAPAYRAAMLTAAAALTLGLVPIVGLKSAKRSSSSPSHSAARPIWRRFSDPRLLVKLLVPRVLVAFGAGLVFPFLNLFYKQRFGLSDATLGWIFGITNVLAALMMLGSGVVAERWSKIRTILVARGISTSLLLIVGFVPSLPVVVAAHWIRGGLMRLGDPLYLAYAMEQLDESERATGSSLMSISWDVGWSTSPYISGVVQVYVDFGPLFVATTVLYGLSLLCVYRFFGRRGRSGREREP